MGGQDQLPLLNSSLKTLLTTACLFKQGQPFTLKPSNMKFHGMAFHQKEDVLLPSWVFLCHTKRVCHAVWCFGGHGE